MTVTTRPRPAEGDEQQILNVETTCPQCDTGALYVWGLDRYFHLDGSANASCWWAAGRRTAAEPRTERPVYVHRVRG